MAIVHRILGSPGRDNALLVRIESGQRVTRLLFDCGDGCASELSIAEIQAVDHLFFSHCHMDHIGGFDTFFRCTFNRETLHNQIWGPPGTSAIMQHRFQGFLWNLIGKMNATWLVSDIYPDGVKRYRFELSEAFSIRHVDDCRPTEAIILDDDDFTVTAIQLQHHGPCLGYLVREKPSVNVRKERLQEMGLRPGPWMKDLKSDAVGGEVVIDGRPYALAQLRAELLVETEGQSLVYLTDFLLDQETFLRLSVLLADCDIAVCESQYHPDDLELAQRNHHTTVWQVGELAATANFGDLVLFHLSDRYSQAQWSAMLTECRIAFARARFPAEWNLKAQ